MIIHDDLQCKVTPTPALPRKREREKKERGLLPAPADLAAYFPLARAMPSSISR